MMVTISMLKIIIFWSKGGSLKTLLLYMSRHWNTIVDERDRKTMLGIANFSRKLSIRSTVLVVTVVISFIMSRFIEIRRSGRILFFNVRLPYNATISPIYELTLVGQFGGCISSAISYTAVDTFIATLVLHVCGQLSNLRYELTNLCANTKAEFQMKLRNIVKKHEHLNRFAETIEDCFNMMLLLQMLGCSVQLCFQCLQAFMVLMGEMNKAVFIQLGFLFTYVGYILIQLYLYCYIGEKLLIESTQMAYAAYDCSWYNLSARKARSLINIMCRARSPLKISAGGFCCFNLELYSETLSKKTGVEYACGWNRYTMTILGIWPANRSLSQASSYIVLAPVLIMLCFICVPQSANLPYVWSDFDLLVDNLSIGNVTITISMLKTIIFWSNGGSLRTLLLYMSRDWNTIVDKRNRKTMLGIANFSRKLSIRSTVLVVTVVIAFVVSRFIEIRRSGRILFFNVRLPYNATISPIYELTLVGQFGGSISAAVSYTAVDTFIATLVLHVCGQLSNLRYELTNLCANTKAEFQMKLGNIVRKHEHLNRFAETIEDCFNMMLLLQMLGCSVQLCFQCLQAFMALMGEINEVVFTQLGFLFIYVGYILIQLYLYCYIGEKLLIESTQIAYAAYDCSWYNLSAREARSLMNIMYRARSPLQISAGGFCCFNRELYSEILKRSVAYMSCILAMNSIE
ncbi:odorant receptor 13a-like [Solenopsis invicta]|uniref:odorant receptor 13a-like n=1 Tax=Solenopsis invicta TaxID=13686 RepID=UPI00193E1150|nr:odorant receptor 13a-like [Solenopsis invicta]